MNSARSAGPRWASITTAGPWTSLRSRRLVWGLATEELEPLLATNPHERLQDRRRSPLRKSICQGGLPALEVARTRERQSPGRLKSAYAFAEYVKTIRAS
jgi:hypothetical protein